jgi:rubrerythrin
MISNPLGLLMIDPSRLVSPPPGNRNFEAFALARLEKHFHAAFPQEPVSVQRESNKGNVPDDLITALQRARVAEKEHALFYRALAAAAEDRGDAALSERFNQLHADEQHHLSRLTARLLELGATPGDLQPSLEAAGIDGWEAAAREREDAEVGRYEALLSDGALDAQTERLLREILDTERHHAAELGGKWTAA